MKNQQINRIKEPSPKKLKLNQHIDLSRHALTSFTDFYGDLMNSTAKSLDLSDNNLKVFLDSNVKLIQMPTVKSINLLNNLQLSI